MSLQTVEDVTTDLGREYRGPADYLPYLRFYGPPGLASSGLIRTAVLSLWEEHARILRLVVQQDIDPTGGPFLLDLYSVSIWGAAEAPAALSQPSAVILAPLAVAALITILKLLIIGLAVIAVAQVVTANWRPAEIGFGLALPLLAGAALLTAWGYASRRAAS